MGQGYHSKIIYGVILDTDATEIYNTEIRFNGKNGDAFESVLEKYKCSKSYEVSPVWIGIGYAATDEWVAKKCKLKDLSSGIPINQLWDVVDDVENANYRVNAVLSYLRQKFKMTFDNPDLLLVTDYD